MHEPMSEKKNISMISIGALSKATGVPTETIRTWERRYGYPVPVRRESGHRRYPLSTIERLRLIKRALDLGHKPSTIVSATPDTINALLTVSEPPASANAGQRALLEADTSSLPEDQARWMELVKAFDGDALARLMRREWNELGAIQFINQRLVPFLHTLGSWWEQGKVHIMHEHFASERLREFLSARWRPMSDEARGPKIVCATLPGEQHILALHLVAVTLAMADLHVVFLGANTPTEEIASAASIFQSPAVAVSVSASADPIRVTQHLHQLRQALPEDLTVLAGGRGAPERIDGITTITNLQALYEWASALRQDAEQTLLN